MKNFLLSLALLASVLTALFVFEKPSSDGLHQQAKPEISGAYEALNFLGNRQTYPNATLPANAHYAAWENWRANSSTNARNHTPPPPWESMGPHNRGGRTLAIALNPQNTNTIYAGSASGGLWKSTTAGVGASAWTQVPTGFPVLGVSTIAIDPTDTLTMYIGTGEVYNYEAAGTGAAFRNTRGSYGMGILKTTDGGLTWSKSLDWSYNQQHGIWMIKMDPTDANTIYAATTEGIYKTTNAGTTWNQVLDVVMGTDLVIHPDNPNIILAACGNFASPGFGIYKSANGGVSWQHITTGLPTYYEGKIQLGFAPSDPDIVYASIGNGFSSATGASWLCRSENFGSSWTIKNTEDYSRWQGWFSHDVAVSPTDPNQIMVIGINVWNSENGGDSLRLRTTGGAGFDNPPIEGPDGSSLYVHSDAHDVIYHPTNPNQVYVASDGGIHRSDDGGFNWYGANGGYQTAQFYNGMSTSQNDTDFMMGGLQDNGTIRWNGDLSWTRVSGGDGSWTAIHPLTDEFYFTSWQWLNMLRTDNGGQDFSYLDFDDYQQDPTSFIAPFVLAPSNGTVMYAGTAVMAKSNDLGDTWAIINNGNPLDGNPILSMEVSPQISNVLYAGTAPNNGQRGHLFVTTTGNFFTDRTADLPDRYPMDITVDPTNPAVAYVVYSGFGTGHVFKTENFGLSWEDISDNLPDVPTNAVIVDPLLPNHVYVGNDLGVFVSTIGGTQWEAYQDGLATATMIFDLKISGPNRKLRAATHGNGAFQRDLLDEAVSTDDITNKELLIGIFPNPAREFVTVQFEQQGTQAAVVDVLDSQGRVLMSQQQASPGSGQQSLQVDFSTLPAGIYFVRLSQDTYQQMGRVVKQ